MIGIQGQKEAKWTHSKGESGGARPLIGGNPPSGPAGAGRVGLSPVGVLCIPFGTNFFFFDFFLNPPLTIPPYLITLGDQIGGYSKRGGLGKNQKNIFSFQKGSTIPPTGDNPTQPAPAGPEGGGSSQALAASGILLRVWYT